MNVKQFLKQNNNLRRLVKKVKIYKEYIADANEFEKFYLEKASKNNSFSYEIMLLVHSIEKGMCMQNPRPFGKEKVLRLKEILVRSQGNNSTFEYKLAVSALMAWTEFFKKNSWSNDEYLEIVEFLSNISNDDLITGNKIMKNPHITENTSFDDVIMSRHSVRDFEDKAIEKDDLDYAIKCFLEAPTACNRQMCKIYQVVDNKKRKVLLDTLLGISGFNKKTVQLFVITYDIAAFDFFGERNQGYLNAGLVAMNFVNGLHARGIGSCFMQWANKRKEDMLVRKTLEIPESEKIAIVIGAGYYKEESVIPCSCRKSNAQVFKVL